MVFYFVTSPPYLSCKAAAQVHGSGAGLGCLEPQHDSGGEFVVSSSTAGLLLFTQRQTHKTRIHDGATTNLAGINNRDHPQFLSLVNFYVSIFCSLK